MEKALDLQQLSDHGLSKQQLAHMPYYRDEYIKTKRG